MQTETRTEAAESAEVGFINPWRLFTGAMVPNWLLLRDEVSPGAKLRYARLAQFAGEHGHCFPKQETMAKQLGCSARRVREYLRELKDLGLIAATQRGLAHPNSYRFRQHPWMGDLPRPDAASYLDRSDPSYPDRSDPSYPDRSDPSYPDRSDSSGPIGEEIQEEEIQGSNTHTAPPAPPRPPSLEEVEVFASMRCIPPEAARKFFHDQEAVGWVNKRGIPIQKWQSALSGYAVTWRAVDAQHRPRRGGTAQAVGAFASIPESSAFHSKF